MFPEKKQGRYEITSFGWNLLARPDERLRPTGVSRDTACGRV